MRLPPHRGRLHVDELHAGQQVVRLAADQLEDQVARTVADVLQRLTIRYDTITIVWYDTIKQQFCKTQQDGQKVAPRTCERCVYWYTVPRT